MKPCAIQPFYFPTSVVFVDDSRTFLSNLCLNLDPGLAYRQFESPFAALIDVNEASTASPVIGELFSLYRHRNDTDPARHVIDVRLDMIHREMYNERRFEQVSIAVVDYDMPNINGLEFCRRLKSRAIKKVLLTGQADEQMAVQAFNEKTIHRFIRKQDSDVMAQIDHAIAELQMEYFEQIQQMLSESLAVGTHLFLFDPEFAQRFAHIRQELGIVEHYLSCMPDGILMLDAHGTLYLLIVQTEEMVQAQYEIAFDQQAPEALLACMRSGNYVPYFWKTAGHYTPDDKNWFSCLHPATEFKGRAWYLYTVIKHPKTFSRKHVYPYRAYLDHLDDKSK